MTGLVIRSLAYIRNSLLQNKVKNGYSFSHDVGWWADRRKFTRNSTEYYKVKMRQTGGNIQTI